MFLMRMPSVLELFHSIVTIHAAYWYLIINYSKPVALEYLVWCVLTAFFFFFLQINRDRSTLPVFQEHHSTMGT